MERFRYIPPGPEEQRAFVAQFCGTLLGLALVALAFRYLLHDGGRRAVMLGAALALIWTMARSAWALELKARRSQQAEVAYDDDGLHVTDAGGATRFVAWKQISAVEVVGGRLRVVWPDGQLAVGSREIENGMKLIQEVAERYARRNDDGPGWRPPSNFIPLTPR